MDYSLNTMTFRKFGKGPGYCNTCYHGNADIHLNVRTFI